MRFKGRALYNLLKLSQMEDPSETVQPWQVAPYRSIYSQELFSRLTKIGISLNEETFLVYGESCDSPEELTDCLHLEDEDHEKYEESYLIIFELWRRFLPKKQSLSLFGDELDHLIDLYDKGELVDEEELQNALSELEDVLDQSADAGTDPEEVFEMVGQYCAHDMETFLYDYIIEQMDAKNTTYASELLDGFYDYVKEKRWFDFLKARLFAVADSDESDALMLGLIELLEEEPDLELSFEICKFLVHQGDTSLFVKAGRLVLDRIEKEEDYKALLHILAEFHRCLDEEMEERAVKDLLLKREGKKDDAIISSEDKKMVLEYLEDPEGNKI
jgi:hypothetical protein